MTPLACLASLLLSAPASAAAPGKVDPELRWSGGDPALCQFALGDAEHPNHPVGTPVEAPAGKVTVRVSCPGKVPLSPPPTTVTVRAGATVRPRVEVAEARVLVSSRRSDVMLAGEVRFYPAGGDLGAAPLATLPTNSTAKVAAGRYDLLVHLTAPKQPHAETLLSGVNLRPGRNGDLVADLSDGSLIAQATENGRPAEGAVRVNLMDGDKKAALGDTQQELRLPAGRYRVLVELRAAANFATQTETVWIRAKKTTQVKAAFETGTLRVDVTQGGKPVDATVRLSLPGASEFFNFFSAPGPVTLTPGRYGLGVLSGAAQPLGELHPPAVEVRAKKEARVKIDLTPATLEVTVEKNGRPADAAVTVREPGGGTVLATMKGGKTILWPGRYEVHAVLENGDAQIEGPFDVKLGDRIVRKLSFETAYLIVSAARGPAPEPTARVQVYRAGAAKPVAEGKHGDWIELPEGTYDLRVSAGADVVWKQGVNVKDRAEVQVGLPELSDAEPLPEGESPAPDFELPEGDAEGE
ncbi:MAG: hypothetical protein H6730_36900 [Deltaproteobacteria bacterium]|nr:hypothetical protein [Deltaproteobacteria bacterium]